MFNLRSRLAQLGGFNEYFCNNCGFTFFLGSNFTCYICSLCSSSNLAFGPAGNFEIPKKEVNDTKETTSNLKLPETITAEQLVDIFKTDF